MDNKRLPAKKIAVLGSTGSIGRQALDVCRSLGYGVSCLTAGSNIRLLADQVREFRPSIAVISDESQYPEMKALLRDLDLDIRCGLEGICEAAAYPGNDLVLNAVVGIAGLRPTLAALEAGVDLALANKETLVAGGCLVTALAKKNNVRILPVDSEHSAVFQCLESGDRRDLRSIILTASGGPFFGMSRQELSTVTAEDALRHPNWAMGPKITIDSATLANKGLEFIEAMWLFDLNPDQIEVVVHRQSILHSAVEFGDHSVIGQMGVADMRLAIQYALTWPRHEPSPVNGLSLTEVGALTFQEPDYRVFTALSSCIQAARRGGLCPAAVNGANEQLVDLFLKGRIGFLEIGDILQQVAEKKQAGNPCSLADIEEADAAARELALSLASSLSH